MTVGKVRANAYGANNSLAWKWVARSTTLFALLGLLFGIGEAAWLYLVPSWPLPRPDVCPVIWSVAPLTDLSIAAMVGLALGLAIATRHFRGIWRHLAHLTSVLLGAVCMLGVVALAGRLAVSAWRQGLRPGNAPLGSVLVFAGLLAVGISRRGRLVWFIRDGSEVHFRRLTVALLASVTVLLGLLTSYTLNLSFPAATASSSPDLTPDKPNIVLITLDTVRADHLSVYGYPRPTTPNLERWARQGVLFDNALAPSSWTLASHASIMTGLLPHQHGADWESPVQGNPWTLASVLQSRGYSTAAFTANLYYGYASWGLEPGFKVYDDDSFSLLHNLASTLAGQVLLQTAYSTWVRPDRFDRRNARQLNEDVFRWFRHKPERPFFLFVNYFDAHEPFVAPAPYDRRFGGASNELLSKASGLMRDPDPAQTLSDTERASLIASYDDCLAYLDAELNRLLTFLSTQPGWANTVVFITADHGEMFGKHGAYGHGWNLYRESLHVPLVVLGPGVPTGARIEGLAATRRIFPTVLDLTLGGRQPFARHSLRALWRPGLGPDGPPHVVISELLSRTAPRESYASAFTSRWHYLEDSAGHKELYDWTRDPEERINLADQEAAIAAELASSLRAYAAKSVQPWKGPLYLRALGLQAGPAAPAVNGAAPGDPIGVSQAAFRRDAHGASAPEAPDKDLLLSLPYD